MCLARSSLSANLLATEERILRETEFVTDGDASCLDRYLVRRVHLRRYGDASALHLARDSHRGSANPDVEGVQHRLKVTSTLSDRWSRRLAESRVDATTDLL